MSPSFKADAIGIIQLIEPDFWGVFSYNRQRAALVLDGAGRYPDHGPIHSAVEATAQACPNGLHHCTAPAWWAECLPINITHPQFTRDGKAHADEDYTRRLQQGFLLLLAPPASLADAIIKIEPAGAGMRQFLALGRQAIDKGLVTARPPRYWLERKKRWHSPLFNIAKRFDPGLDAGALLHDAIYRDDLASVRDLLAQGAKPDGYRPFRGYPLLLAVQKGRAPIVRLLLSAGANPDIEFQVSQDCRFSANSYAKRLLSPEDNAVHQLLEHHQKLTLMSSRQPESNGIRGGFIWLSRTRHSDHALEGMAYVDEISLILHDENDQPNGELSVRWFPTAEGPVACLMSFDDGWDVLKRHHAGMQALRITAGTSPTPQQFVDVLLSQGATDLTPGPAAEANSTPEIEASQQMPVHRGPAGIPVFCWDRTPEQGSQKGPDGLRYQEQIRLGFQDTSSNNLSHEMAIRWYTIGSSQTPRLEVFNESWSALTDRPELIDLLDEFYDWKPAPQELIEAFTRIGFREMAITDSDRPDHSQGNAP